jgi:hypothetical protein
MAFFGGIGCAATQRLSSFASSDICEREADTFINLVASSSSN